MSSTIRTDYCSVSLMMFSYVPARWLISHKVAAWVAASAFRVELKFISFRTVSASIGLDIAALGESLLSWSCSMLAVFESWAASFLLALDAGSYCAPLRGCSLLLCLYRKSRGRLHSITLSTLCAMFFKYSQLSCWASSASLLIDFDSSNIPVSSSMSRYMRASGSTHHLCFSCRRFRFRT